MRRFLADTFAMIAFSTVVGMVTEIFISGMTLNQSIHARLVSMPVNLLTAKLYGMFRDWTFKQTRANEGGPIRKGFADILAFVFFQVPLYATVLSTSGANLHQIATACGTVTIFSVFAGRPYGIFLDMSRSLLRIKNSTVGPREEATS
ncbi:MAG: L-alanine exporter AlaE [bacterium]